MPADTPANAAPETDRIAKVMARSGICSRRDAEKMILEGRVAVNGKVIKSPALDVGAADRVTLDGKPIDAPQETRLWLYYKPLGLVTSEKDEKGRQTVFDTLPEGMPRVMSVGRLDLNSEGLLLLTNDGGLKRRLELPETGWLRKYRVRVNGRPDTSTFDPLRRGIVIEGEDFQPMEISLDRQQGANAWLTIGIREGKNREIRRAMDEVKLAVNRLIRVSYGPFRLNEMQPGDVVEVKRKVLREQLGERLLTGNEAAPERVERRPRAAEAGAGAEKRPFMRGPRAEDGAVRKPRAPRAVGTAAPREMDARKPYAPREGGERKSYGDKPASGERKPYAPREGGERKSYGDTPASGERRPYAPREGGERKSYGDKPASGERKPYAPREGGERKSYGDTPASNARKPYAPREGGERKSYGDKPASGARKPSGKPAFGSAGFKSHGAGPGAKPSGSRPGARPGPKPGPRSRG